jgi:hypothetical protein
MIQETHIAYQQFGTACFQLTGDHWFQSRIKTGMPCRLPFMEYDGNGWFHLQAGFCWDGPSNPLQVGSAPKCQMRTSLYHDAKYRVMREGLIDPAVWKDTADEELKEVGEIDGMPSLEAEAFFVAVSEFGGSDARGGDPIIVAP